MKKIFYLLFIGLLLSCSSTKNVTNNKQKTIVINNVKVVENKGDSYENAIIILAKNSSEGISSEYNYIAKLHGTKWKDWKPLGQSLNYNNKIPYDIIEIEDIKNNTTKKYYFNIKSFFGKF